eukprot:CAMPEP_0197036926 /NCGR_PEP_ID=MMETSP1384-20130603/14271_1 /TAXON_ID=29189 /ORGANISM="Ammonia sp." /LENGTH=124 /DNA_ID=CAMNT_0042467159 /DNA_START=78 /DNA_END=452 /DNA_ORIENTATION=-
MQRIWGPNAKNIKGWRDMKHVFRKVDENRFLMKYGRIPVRPKIPWEKDGYGRPIYFDDVPVVGGERMRHLRMDRMAINNRYTIERWWPAGKAVVIFMSCYCAYDQLWKGGHTQLWGYPRHYGEI